MHLPFRKPRHGRPYRDDSMVLCKDAVIAVPVLSGRRHERNMHELAGATTSFVSAAF